MVGCAPSVVVGCGVKLGFPVEEGFEGRDGGVCGVLREIMAEDGPDEAEARERHQCRMSPFSCENPIKQEPNTPVA